MTGVDKVGLVRLIWEMAQNYVDQAYGMDATSQALSERDSKFAPNRPKLVNSDSSSLSDAFDENAENTNGIVIDLIPNKKGNS